MKELIKPILIQQYHVSHYVERIALTGLLLFCITKLLIVRPTMTMAKMIQAAVYSEDVWESSVKGLGIRANKVQILNESDCIKIKPKSYMDRKELREIHDILRVQGFNWLTNGKEHRRWYRYRVVTLHQS